MQVWWTTFVFRNDDSWIGLYKRVEDSDDDSASAQYWLDGSSSTYRGEWKNNQPNGDAFCIRMKKDGKLEDKDCDRSEKFVCKKTGG